MITLYKKDAKGKVRIWKAFDTKAGFTVEHGLMDGQRQREIFEIDYGNQGRTRIQQIELEMKGRAKKKKDNGYTHALANIDDTNKNQLGFEMQMKAKLLKDGTEPGIGYKYAYAQRKYNGHRCTITRHKGKKIAYSRGGQLITSIKHIIKDIKVKEGQKIDGELYIHGLSLQKISSKVRTQNVTDRDLKFVIFDQMSDKPFHKRFFKIQKQKSEHIIMCETIKVEDFEQVRKLFFQFRAEKYEGAMLRHGRKGYDYGIRSPQILKIKRLDGEGYYDDEFEVIGVVASVEGWARLVLKTEKGKIFKVACHGTHYEKREVLENIEKYIGKMVTVEYPELTDSGRPSQGVALHWREEE